MLLFFKNSINFFSSVSVILISNVWSLTFSHPLFLLSISNIKNLFKLISVLHLPLKSLYIFPPIKLLIFIVFLQLNNLFLSFSNKNLLQTLFSYEKKIRSLYLLFSFFFYYLIKKYVFYQMTYSSNINITNSYFENIKYKFNDIN